ncbi:MAG: hypothetical protein ACO3RU_11065 [Planctomycetota bacterium]
MSAGPSGPATLTSHWTAPIALQPWPPPCATARAPDDDTPDEVLVAAVLAHALGAGAGVGGGAAPAASTAQDGAALWQQLGGFRVFGGAR